ncbi:MAG: low specificity L-threonine aldolase [Paramuribaculum sp.]|nr:low specificity L-threonine aldolase [Paramuribaculum sp.]
MLHFDSDYMRGAHPKVLERLIETNLEQTSGYGTDEYTLRTKKLILDACGIASGNVWFLVGGTQTNSTVIDALLRHHEGVIAADSSHINSHEAGAIESTGHKVLTLQNHDGKLQASEIEQLMEDFYSDESRDHCVKPAMVYISHPTEYGTLYSLTELSEISEVCHKFKLPLYLDGARLGYALASDVNDISLKDVARLCDVFYIGGTKCGTLFGEAVVTSKPELLPAFFSLIKQHGALLSKGRLTALQFEALFTDNLYERICRNAILQAMKIKNAFLERGYELFIDSPTNQQFFNLPNQTIEYLKRWATFEQWGPKGREYTPVRFVTDWGTSDEEIQQLISKLSAI